MEVTGMAALEFSRLPIDPAEGFPQSFRLALAGRTYQFRLQASVTEQVAEAAPDGLLDLPAEGAYLVLAVGREEPAGLTPVLRRKLVPGLLYQAAELALTFRTMRVDRRNLNGLGSFGSDVVGGVAVR
jgi:hypothetical protein